MDELHGFLREHAKDGLLPWQAQVKAGERFGLSHAEIEESALTLGLLPLRYQRNRQTFSIADQLTLFRSRVAVIGCGGLGGYVIEQLARLGIGTIVAFDPDIFEEHNLNRQLFSSPGWIGRAKVEAAAARVAEINPAVTLVARREAYGPENGKELLRGTNAAVDALDSIPARLALVATCAELGIPLVHGAIAGWYGQVTTQLPGDDTIQRLYSGWVEGPGVEQHWGNPSFTPAVVAGIETAEVCKVLLSRGSALHGRQLSINLLDMNFEEVPFKRHGA